MNPLVLEVIGADGGWALVYGSRAPSVERFGTQDAAIRRARQVARAEGCTAEIRIRADRAVLSEWIYPTKTGRSPFPA